MLKNLNKIEFWLSTKADVGLLLLRLFIGLRIVYGAFDNIISWRVFSND
jgi:hypothetical protein